MVIRIEHIGIAVSDLEKGNDVFSRLLNRPPYKTEKVEREGVTTSFFAAEGGKIELLAADREDSPVAKFISKRGEGIHHMALYVDDIELEIARLKNAGFEFISDVPKAGADNKRICFLHPRTTCGVLVELCEEMKEGV
jgi:methylmalonyl-CoA/ethylmalonyl-CoA epimerase